jgi:hypothetical protein
MTATHDSKAEKCSLFFGTLVLDVSSGSSPSHHTELLHNILALNEVDPTFSVGMPERQSDTNLYNSTCVDHVRQIVVT